LKAAKAYTSSKASSTNSIIITPRTDEDEEDRPSVPHQPTSPPNYVPPATPGVFLPTSTPELQLKPGPSRTPTQGIYYNPAPTSTPTLKSALEISIEAGIGSGFIDQFSLGGYNAGAERGMDLPGMVDSLAISLIASGNPYGVAAGDVLKKANTIAVVFASTLDYADYAMDPSNRDYDNFDWVNPNLPPQDNHFGTISP
jgi:hypothetical protein